MKIHLTPIDQVVPYARNPRINEHAIEKVAASIREFGFRQPIVVDSEGVIVVGHVRHAAARRLGLEQVPVHVADNLSAEQIKAYRITDNRSGEESQWDDELLSLEFSELASHEFDTSLLGFDEAELERIERAVNAEVEDGFEEEEKDLNKVPEADTQATIGEYRFTLPREEYLAWMEEIKQAVGFEKEKVVTELKRRLGV